MLRRTIAVAAATTAVVLAWAATGSDAGGYLARHEPDVLAAVPPPPAIGGLADRFDRSVFLHTRALSGSARWRLAQTDADESTRALLADFSCAVGVSLTPSNAPHLTKLLEHATPDVEGAVDLSKSRFRRLRPFLRYPGALCTPRTPHLEQSWDYPSGHTTKSWAFGLILARLAPDRAAEILGRARAFGESRVVCGVHNVSAIVAGRVTADTVVAALEGDPDFRADLAGARNELVALRADGPRPDPAACRVEQRLVAEKPW